MYCCSNTHWWNSLHYAFIIYALWSHTRTVVRQCCKPVRATMQVNGEAQNLTPHDAQTPYAGIIKTGRGDYVVDLYTSRSAQGFRFRTCVTLSAKLHTKRCYFFRRFLQLATAKAPGRILTQNTPKLAVLRKDVPFRGREHKI